MLCGSARKTSRRACLPPIARPPATHGLSFFLLENTFNDQATQTAHDTYGLGVRRPIYTTTHRPPRTFPLHLQGTWETAFWRNARLGRSYSLISANTRQTRAEQSMFPHAAAVIDCGTSSFKAGFASQRQPEVFCSGECRPLPSHPACSGIPSHESFRLRTRFISFLAV